MTAEEKAEHDRRSYDTEIARVKSELVDVHEELKELRGDIKDLIEAWNTAKGITSFVKWLSGILVGVASIFAFVKGWKL